MRSERGTAMTLLRELTTEYERAQIHQAGVVLTFFAEATTILLPLAIDRLAMIDSPTALYNLYKGFFAEG